jgi:hypothetical protein
LLGAVRRDAEESRQKADPVLAKLVPELLQQLDRHYAAA